MSSFFSKSLAVIAACALFAPAQALASHKSPLYVAADQYRDTIKDFERAVLKSRYIDRYQERVVDRLEDATSDLKSAARDPEDFHELLAEWQQIQVLHQQVKSVIFGNPQCPSRPELIGCWERAEFAFAQFALQIGQFNCDLPVVETRYRQSIYVPVTPFSDCPSITRVPSYRVPVQPLPHSRFGSPLNQLPNHPAPFQTNPAPFQTNPAPGGPLPSYRNPVPALPETVVPERALPQELPPPSRVPGTLQPSSWYRSSPDSRPSPYWNAGRSVIDSPGRAWSHDARRTLQRTVSYQGINATSLVSLIARLID